jgi:hypothetical protein
VPPPENPRDPWRRAPVGELQEQLLPRWFVLTALISIPLAVAAVVGAFVVFGPDEVPVAARRPPPADGLTNAVGAFEVGDAEPASFDAPCPLVEDLRVAGTARDRAVLAEGLGALCDADVPAEAAEAVRAFAEADGVVRFAAFEATGVDSTTDAGADPPRILVNAKFTATTPAWIAPLLVHDAVALAGDPADADTALAARRAEARVCEHLFAETRPSRGCDDAAALLALDDPLAALRAAGYR